MRTILTILLVAAVSVGGFLGYRALETQKQELSSIKEIVEDVKLGAFRPSGYTGTLLTRLNEGGAESSFKTTPCTTPDGQTISTSAVGDYIVITINPGAANEEKISATAVSCSGTTLTWTTGTRGLSFLSTSQITANVKQHSIGETVIISNDDQFLTTQYVDIDGTQTIAGQKTFTLGALFSTAASSTDECTVNSEYCTKLYIDNSSNQGAATSTETNGGIVELATALEAGSSTPTTADIPYVLQAQNATTTPQSGCGAGYTGVAGAACVVVADLTGKIRQTWIDLTEAFTWTGAHIFSSTATFNGATSFTATSTANANTIGFTNQSNVTAGETFTGFTLPQPAYIATSTGKVFVSDADVALDKEFDGFVVSSGALDETVVLQTDGVVGGFTGLTAGSEYYVSDTSGVLSTTAGTAKIYVGKAISTTAINIDTSRADEYLGVSQSLSVGQTYSIPLYTKKIIGNIQTSGTDFTVHNTIVLTLHGNLTGSVQNCDIGTGNCFAQSSNILTADFTLSSTTFSGSSGGEGTIYFYR